MSLEVIGVEDIIKVLKHIDANLARKVLRKSIRKVLKPMCDNIKAVAPVGKTELDAGDKPHGTIKKYTKVAAGKRKKNWVTMTIKVDNKDREANPYWSAFTEKGTKKQPAQNWMKDVFDRDVNPARNTLLQDIKQGVEDLAKKR